MDFQKQLWYLTLLISTSALLASASDAFSCEKLTGNCTCAQIRGVTNGVRTTYFEIICPLGYFENVTLFYTPDKTIQVVCNNFDKSAEVEITVTEPISGLQLPEEVKRLSVNRYFINNCILSNSTLDVLGATGVKELEITGNASFAGAYLTKDFFKSVAGNLQKLRLNNVGLERVSRDIFAGMKNLNTLSLFENTLQEIDGQFKDLSNLKDLDLSRNKISYISEDAFAGLGQLQILHLFNNEISDLPERVFDTLLSLHSLELSGNKFEKLPKQLLSKLVNLKRFSVTRNDLKSVPQSLFVNNSKLNSMRLSRNPNLKTLPHALLSNLPKLETVQLDYCALETLPEDLLANSENVLTIDLNTNNLKDIGVNLLAGLKKLQKLNLNNNEISELKSGVFKSLGLLETLELNHNSLKRIDADAWEGTKKLDTLHLNHNELEHLSLSSVSELVYVDLSHNKLKLNSSTQSTPFNGCFKLREINLSHNSVTEVFMDFSLINLKVLNLSYNNISYIDYKNMQSMTDRLDIDLRYNSITTINMVGIEAIALSENNSLNSTLHLDNNPLNCNCQAYDLLRYLDRSMAHAVENRLILHVDKLQCDSPAKFNGMKVKSIKPQWVACEFPECSRNCTCSFKPFQNTYVVDCAKRNLTFAPVIRAPGKFNRTEVYLQDNLLKEAPGLDRGYENVTVLNLSNNMIGKMNWIPIKAELVNLDNNNITHLDYKLLSKLNMSTTLHNNPWTCNCDAMNLSNYVKTNLIPFKENITCKGHHKLLTSLLEKEICPTHDALIIIIVFALALLITIGSVMYALYYKYNREIKVWLYAHNLCMWFVSEEDLDKDKLYDAFISFSHVDDNFVMDELVAKLENGPNPFKLCIHMRNWIPGEFIATQVMDSVKNSRRTIVVLSPDFLKSVWGKMEFRVAHTEAMSEGRARVIVILLGDIDTDSNLDDELMSYLKTNTYMKWGDPWFWDKLRYAMPHQKMSNANIQKFQNISINLDKMDLINGNSTPNTTSTPPAHPLLLKSHPLDFKPSEEMRNTPPAESGNDVKC